MIKVAVCDDDVAFAGSTQSFLDKISDEYHVELEISVFLSGSELVKEYRDGNSFDLIFLDIEMNGMDGIATARNIRELDYHVLIVYISSHDEYLRQLFEAEPFRFLKKPVEYEEFCGVFFQAQKRITAMQSNYFCFRSGKNLMKIFCKDILYFESSGRKVILHTVQRTYEFYDKLNNIEEKLKELRFVRIHKAYLVNLDNVESFQYERLALTDGTILSISEKNRPRLRNEFWHYFRMEE
ncbi:MAG: response regulator transcription factor [Lachnospiraceae bacterium]|nr:response regulator transcription factor [Lachnospiraceae bacterium]